MKSMNSYKGRNSRNNERAHDAHNKRAYQAREDYNSTTGEEQIKYYNRIVRYYPELLNDAGEVVN